MTWRPVKIVQNYDECNAEENYSLFMYIFTCESSSLPLSWYFSNFNSCSFSTSEFQEDFRSRLRASSYDEP